MEALKGSVSRGKWLLVRVRVPVVNSMKQGCWLSIPCDQIWIDLKYEKLLDFCYICGCLNHEYKDCDIELCMKLKKRSVDRGYGVHLRAETFTPAKSPGSFLSATRSGMLPTGSRG